MKPLLILAADGQCAVTLRGFFERRGYHSSLGCGPVELNGIAFNPEKDILVHPEKDPGVWTNSHGIMLAERKTYEKALIILDEAWDGAPAPETIITDIETLIVNEAKWGRHRFEVILIRPELEAWIWQRNPHVVEAFGFSGTDAELWTLLEQQSLTIEHGRRTHRFVPTNEMAGYPPAWRKTEPKPDNPKGLVEALSRHCQSGPPSGIYSEISSTISVKGCADPAFQLLRQKLRDWFPKRKEAWEK